MPIKIVVANLNASIQNQNINNTNRKHVFELEEINKYLDEGWKIWKQETVLPPHSTTSFSIIFYLEK